MPWKIVEGGEDCLFEVVKEDSGEHVACHPTREKAEAHVRALYANEPGMMQGAHLDAPYTDLAPIEYRSANVGNVDFQQRIITVVAAPKRDLERAVRAGRVRCCCGRPS